MTLRIIKATNIYWLKYEFPLIKIVLLEGRLLKIVFVLLLKLLIFYLKRSRVVI